MTVTIANEHNKAHRRVRVGHRFITMTRKVPTHSHKIWRARLMRVSQIPAMKLRNYTPTRTQTLLAFSLLRYLCQNDPCFFPSCLLIFAPLTLLHKPFTADFWTSWVLECNDRDLQWLGLSSQFATVITVFCSHLLIWYTYKLRTLPANFWWQRRPNTESTFIWNSVVIWVSLEYVLVFWSSMHAYRRLLK